MSPPRSPLLAVECKLTVTPFVQTSRLTGFMPPQTVPQAILCGCFSSSGAVIMELTDPYLGCRTDRIAVQLEMPAVSLKEMAGMSPADSQPLIEPLNDRAVYGEARTTKRFAARACKEVVLHKGENLELLPQLTAETLADGVLGPFVQVRVPRRAVIESDCWDTTQDVVRPMAVRQI